MENFQFCDKYYFRCLIFHYTKQGLKPNEIKQNLTRIYGNISPCYQTILFWSRRFSFGNTSIKDDHRSGRPSDMIPEKYENVIRRKIKLDPFITVRNIASIAHCSVTTAYGTLTHGLGYKSINCKWVSHKLTDKLKQSRIDFCHSFLNHYGDLKKKITYNLVTGDETWIRCYEPPAAAGAKVWVLENELVPTELQTNINAKKIMVAVFFSRKGLELSVNYEENQRVTATFYRDKCLVPLLEHWKKDHPNSLTPKLCLHYDNAPIHTSALITKFLKLNDIEKLKFPPYSPDLAPCDFRLFPMLKQRLRGKKISSIHALILDWKRLLNNLNPDDFTKAFEEWIKRAHIVILKQGEYY